MIYFARSRPEAGEIVPCMGKSHTFADQFRRAVETVLTREDANGGITKRRI